MREWRVINEMPENDRDVPIHQVYTWLLTTDDHVVIVSKDGKNWQLPGGKPDGGENAIQAANREVFEETGIDMSPYLDDLHFFGVYTIDDPAMENQPPHYRQVRSWLQLPVDARDLYLSTSGESRGQRPEDAVRFVRGVPAKDIIKFIPWLVQTDEYKYLKRNKIIRRSEITE